MPPVYLDNLMQCLYVTSAHINKRHRFKQHLPYECVNLDSALQFLK